MNSFTLQENLLALLPMWNYNIAKPLKQFLDDGISLEMYYCIQTLRWYKKPMKMSELSEATKTPKKQMTKVADRLVEQELVERIYDPSDRRIVRLKLTEQASSYIDHFLEQDGGYFKSIMEKLEPEDVPRFQSAVKTLCEVLAKIPSGEIALEECPKQQDELEANP